ncbi:MAG: UDP-3-O-(3-hydroxymyristoyl)glucosamine N-acyltransferase [Bacteroidetes bacterium RIFCSPLOWO2_02_FULL_36_8]|nr:MAG: UDP-3-O-(3-hydroxymyristoyl)glucosamine N-acyltransferase [Bacteroidetes bacterium RIFCSPLOWO2_02_FULL_36_8]OFY69894.1 MAG: UDP-3-O-(3-hydroxymyristoyl)glucosamine N-acyltransferase [Bacteroidetes bacterium RIFCSPLOWO2_12_FULL_37_12]
MLEFSAKDIASLIGGEIHGNHSAKINTLSSIEEGKEGSLCFYNNNKYEKYLLSTTATVIIINRGLNFPAAIKSTLIFVNDAHAAFITLLNFYKKLQQNYAGIENPSFISPDVSYGKDFYLGAFSYLGKGVKAGYNVKIYPNSYIGENVTIGDHSIIYPGVKIYRDIIIGKHCIIHAGAVIGADGFGYKINDDKSCQKIPHVGKVIIEDDCEIGANATIDRATVGNTLIKKGVKIDNLVQIAHNVQIGEYTRLSAQSGIAGSTQVGSYCVFGGQAAVADHLIIATGTKLGAQTGVNKSITDENTFVNGSPAMGYRDSLRSLKHFQDLPNIVKRLAAIEKEIFNSDVLKT